MEKNKSLILLLLLGVIWGPSFFYIKLALNELTPFMIVFYRMTFAAICMGIYLYVRKVPLWENLDQWRSHLFMGIFSCALPFLLITTGEVWITSSTASIVNGSTPVMTAIMAHFLIHSERMNRQKAYGIALGLIGVVCVNIPALVNHSVSESKGIFCIALASVCYAIGMIYMRFKGREMRPGPNFPFLQFVASALFLGLIGIFTQSFHFNLGLSMIAVSSVGALSIFSTVIAFILYHLLIAREGATYVSYVTLLFPIVGIALGKLILGDEITPFAYVGTVLILSGLLLIQKKKSHPNPTVTHSN
ncbi:MAG: putative amino-acid metabolite efflux pump [Chlamydiia bacterium]|nr:putative amino-acid metabolite efflux pump [Chlamydiia bacterium]